MAALTERTALRRAAVSSYIGTAFEFYDFLLYGSAAALVFDRLFFPDLDPLAGTLAAFGTLAAGYVARPLGGIVFGHFGDRVGRRSMLLITMTLMGTASTLIGVLPTYTAVGVTAPILLVTLRVIQGIAVGGEWGGAALMTVESAAADRRGRWSGLTQMGGPTGSLLSTIALSLVAMLPGDAFLAWGWRIPFLFSAVLLGVGLFVRLRVAEPPVFAELRSRGRVARVPLVEVFRTHPRQVGLATAAGFGMFTGQGLFTAYMLSYAVGIGYARPQVLNALVLSSLVAVAAMPLYAALSDRVGRRPVYIGGALATAITGWPLFALVNTHDPVLLAVAMVIGQGVVNSAMYGPLAALLSEMFGTRTRYTGASLGYQLATVLGAGFGPLIAASLLSAAGGGTNSGGIVAFLAAAGLVSAAAVWLAAETRGRALTETAPAGSDHA